MTDAEQIAAFQKANTFDCRSLLARITKEQCGKNQARKLFVCLDCDHKVGVLPVIPSTFNPHKRDHILQKQREEKKQLSSPCNKNCGKTQMLKGLCSGCFRAEYKMSIAEFKAKGKVVSPPLGTPEKPVNPTPAVDERRGLNILLEQNGGILDIPYPLMSRMEEKVITFPEIINLIELLLDGKLRRIT